MSQLTNAAIITIGDELLIGQVIDTNSAWIAQQLNMHGFHVQRRVAVGDVWNEIWRALDEESVGADIVLITGGLGPTADDITKPLLSEYFGGKLVLDQATLDHVTYLFEKVFRRPGPMLERNRKQAEVPDVCTVLKNEVGTAPGMLFEKNGKLFFSMPGVPHEMKWLMEHQVIPIIQQRFFPGAIEHRTILTQGIGESFLAERIKDFEEALPAHVKLAYLPGYGMVRLRLTARGNDPVSLKNEIDHLHRELQLLVADVMVVNEDFTMEQVVGRLLKQQGKTVCTAESCTGGYIAHLLTVHPGSSAFFSGSVVSYSNSIKQQVLGVSETTLQTAGAVSEATVLQMATHARELMHTDYAVAVSGIMGPDGGTADKPVGTVWMAVSTPLKTEAKLIQLRFDRRRNIELTAIQALNMLRMAILQNT
ncbi:CinA family nicotinamide mononucleotide deamidase-related protein [Deminuibacter soli]|uniref:CinA-like protein n=1 Tax=Deminuibacter soli TaxID=2291815 RepID=A0A3E1NJ81_9BACT|nr:CinA family nicotinamide mononucleotide deamidase-related protein [Deminuibacter soli]RFM27884.1 nicotinamide-nucleotide amidohydrolase family protein [Deminuibacter soli]